MQTTMAVVDARVSQRRLLLARWEGESAIAFVRCVVSDVALIVVEARTGASAIRERHSEVIRGRE